MSRTPLIHSLAAIGLVTLALTTVARAGTMYAVDSSRALYTIDLGTGAKTLVGTVSSTAGTPGALARDHATNTVYLSSSSLDNLYTVDLTTGAVTLIGNYGPSTIVMHGLEFDSSTNTLYGSSDGDLWTIDKTTGAATSVADSGVGAFVNLGYVSTTNTLYAFSGASDSTYTVNRMTGAFTLLGPLGGGVTAPHALAFNPDDGVLYMLDTTLDNLYRIDQVTGAAVLIGSTGTANLLGMVYVTDAVSAVPYCFGDGTSTACPCSPVPVPYGAPGKGCPTNVFPGGALATASGNPSLAADTLVLTGTDMINGSMLFYQGPAQQSGGLGAVFGDGLRCVSTSGVRRFKVKTVASNTASYPGAGDNPISVAGLLLAPGVRHYQGWYRSANPTFCTPETFNLTNGLTVTWGP